MGELDGFQEYVRRRQGALLRTAYLFTGDRYLAQDLVQAVLVRVWVRWDRIGQVADVDAYVNRVLFSVHTGWRRRFWHKEVSHGRLPESAVSSADQENTADRLAMLAALGRLPARQRAVIVLRFYQDLSEVRTAEILGCSVGTVKSQASKALTSLRRIVPELLSAVGPQRKEVP